MRFYLLNGCEMSDLLTTWQDLDWPDIKASKPLETGNGVIDEEAFQTIEVDKVFTAVNHTQTLTGQACLYRSLAQPLADKSAIDAKQQAVAELQEQPELMAALDAIVSDAAYHESSFYLLLFGSFLGTFGTARSEHEIEGYGYHVYKKGVRLLPELSERLASVDRPNSPYLTGLFDAFNAFSQSRAYSLMTDTVYVTEYSLQSKQERAHSWLPAVSFVPRLFKPLLFVAAAILYWLLSHFAPTALFSAIPDEALLLTPFLLLYIPLVGGFDRDHCIIPLRKEYKASPDVAAALDALGQLDELLSFAKFSQRFPHETVLPTFNDSEHFALTLTQAKNPVLGAHITDYVGNDLSLTDERLLLITGPNSGGKTAFCKTIAQIQLLAQTGSPIPAQAAQLTVADRVFYQAPEISHLDDGEGRFGTELKRTKDIFLASSARSLVILDELSEGTTFEEKMESSTNVLNGFYRKGNTTLLITHNHQLVDAFIKKRQGIAMQVEFADEAPTYRLIPGISRVSHADRVAKKIGFSKEDIDHYLENKQ